MSGQSIVWFKRPEELFDRAAAQPPPGVDRPVVKSISATRGPAAVTQRSLIDRLARA